MHESDPDPDRAQIHARSTDWENNPLPISQVQEYGKKSKSVHDKAYNHHLHAYQSDPTPGNLLQTITFHHCN
jgi:hypothetical protein